MNLYSVEIEFEDGSTPYYRMRMDRATYGEEMKKWKRKYNLTLKRRDMNLNSDWFVSVRARKKETEGAST